MPGYFSRSPPRSPRRALQFARLQEEEDQDAPYPTNNTRTRTRTGTSSVSAKPSQHDVVTFTSIPRSPRNALQFALLIQDDECDEDDEPEFLEHDHTGGATATAQPVIRISMPEQGLYFPGPEVGAIPLLDDTTGSSDTASSSTTSILTCESKTKHAPRSCSSYPILDPPSNQPPSPSSTCHEELMLEHEEEEQHYSIHVEMAKSAFLRNPCQELWEDLVRCFHYQYAQELGLIATGCSDSTSAANRIVKVGGGCNHIEDEGEEDWADFEDDDNNEMVTISDDGSNPECLIGAAPAEWPTNGTQATVSKEEEVVHIVEDNSAENKENVETGQALARLKNSLVSLEEKAMSLLHQHPHHHIIFDGSDFPESKFDEEYDQDDSSMGDCWIERDVSPASLTMASEEEEKSNDAKSNVVEEGASNGFISEKGGVTRDDASIHMIMQGSKKEAAPNSMPNESSKVKSFSAPIKTTSMPQPSLSSKPMPYVLNEIQHWENCIVQYDQSHVNVVAAALDQAITQEGGSAGWKVGQIVEVVPCSLLEGGGSSSQEEVVADDEILYVV